MADLQKLIEKRANLWEETKNFLDEKTDKDGKISAEDAAAYDKMENDLDALSKNIERYQRQATMEKHFAQPTTQPVLNNPQNNLEVKAGRASEEYKKAALNTLRTKFTQVYNVMQEGVAADGGYLVPTEWDERLIDTLDEENIMRKLGTSITATGEHEITIAATKPAAAWLSEGQAITFSNATFNQKSLKAYKLAVGVQVTNELLADSMFNLESYILDQFGKALSNAEEDKFINGTGTNQPTGLLNDAEIGVTTTSATAITSDEIINLVYSLKRPYRKNASFIVNDATLAAVRKLKDTTQNYLWQPSFAAGEPDRLLGYPIYTSAYMPTIEAEAKVAVFGDISYYNIGDRGTRTFQQLNEVYAPNFVTGFLMSERVDGVLVLPEAVQVLQMKA